MLENVPLSFEAGQLVGIMGPNGASKTTCFNVLTGRYKPDRGHVAFDGHDITGRSPQEIIRLGVARSFQIMNLFDDFTVFENIAIALPAARARGWNAFAQAYADRTLEHEVLEILGKVGLADRVDDPAKALPYGARRVLEIGVALACRPKLLFLDEPQFNTQDGYIVFMLDFFRRLRGDGRLVFVCLHPTAQFQLDILHELCERFLFVNGGKVDNYARYSCVVAQPEVRTYLGALAP